MNRMLLCIENIIYKYYIMFCIYSSLCKRNFIETNYRRKTSNTYTQEYVKGVLSYIVKPEMKKKDFLKIENIVYDNDGNFGQFVSIDME